MTEFRFVLLLEDGEPADPAVFVTFLPEWRVGDVFAAGADLRRFRIVNVEPAAAESPFDAVWTVAPADELG